LGEILFVQAKSENFFPIGTFRFQSLGRDSVCSSNCHNRGVALAKPVSISWARFCLFKLSSFITSSLFIIRFNLLGEILFVQALLRPSSSANSASFNLLGEILFVQACMASNLRWARGQFQSLGRDSVCSSREAANKRERQIQVSISWARFCLFKPGLATHSIFVIICFNLLGEILFVQA